MEHTTAKQVTEKAIQILGCTPAAFAKKAGVSQNAVWKLLNGVTKNIKVSTAKRFEDAVDGKITQLEFLGIKQGDCEGKQSHGTEAEDRKNNAMDGTRDQGQPVEAGEHTEAINEQAA